VRRLAALRAIDERVTHRSTGGDYDPQMADDDWYKPHRPPAPPRQSKPGEKLFEFLRGHDRFLCELRDHGETYGGETQFFQRGHVIIGRRFDRALDPTRTPREYRDPAGSSMRNPLYVRLGRNANLPARRAQHTREGRDVAGTNGLMAG
jgi:hypothetical protein